MRKKLLNNNLANSISKGGVLYRPGEIPTLTKEQIAQANLVNKLPRDFPIANWENMGTKQQLQQMKYSGLNAQQQWSLLNSNVPLSALDQYNQAQTQSESTALAARVAASMVNTSAQVAAAKAQAAVGKPTVSTPLQTSAQLRKYDVWQEEYTPRYYGKAASGAGAAITPKNTLGAAVAIKPVNRDGQSGNSDGDQGKKDSRWKNLLSNWLTTQPFPMAAKNGAFLNTLLQNIGFNSGNGGITPTSTPLKVNIDLVTPTPSPKITPTPSPKQTPSPTPKPTANLDMISKFVTEQRNQKNPFFLLYSQKEKDRNDCSTQAYDFYEIKGDKNPLRGTEHKTCDSYYLKYTNPTDSFIESGGIVQSSVPSDNRHRIPPIPDNWQAETEVGDIVIWKDEAEYYPNGYLVRHDGDDWHVGICTGDQQMVDRGIWEENNPNGKQYGIFARGLDTVKSSYDVIMIIKPGDEVRLTLDDIYYYLENQH